MVKLTISADTAQGCAKTLEFLKPFTTSSKPPKKSSGKYYKAYAWMDEINLKGVPHARLSG